jgi:hypothetical protein
MKTSTRTALLLSGILAIAAPQVVLADQAMGATTSALSATAYGTQRQVLKAASYGPNFPVDTAGQTSSLTREQVRDEVTKARAEGLLLSSNPEAYFRRDASTGTPSHTSADKVEAAMGESTMNVH